MTICGVDNTFDTLHELETPQTHKTHETHRFTALKPQYSPRSSHRIDMADCTRKMNQELTLQDNPIITKPIVTEYRTTGAARQPTKHTVGAARQPTKHIAGAARQPMEHTTGVAKNPTEVIISAARTLDISMIGAASLNHFV